MEKLAIKNKKSSQILFTIMTLLFSSPLMATSFIERPFPQTIQDTPTITRGKVLSSQSDWAIGSDGVKRLFTYTTIEVTEPLKGRPPEHQSIVVREIGGEKDGVSMSISGAAKFVVGEDTVLLLSEQKPAIENFQNGYFQLEGLNQGKYLVKKNAEGLEILEGAGIDSHFHDAEAQPWTLTELKELIQAQAEGREFFRAREIQSEQNSQSSMLSKHSETPRAKNTDAAPSFPSELHSKQTNEEDSLATPSNHLTGTILWLVGILFGLLVVVIFYFRRENSKNES